MDRATAGRINGKKGGRPKGSKTSNPIQREIERELVREQVIKHRAKMVQAQIEHACGISYMVLRHEDGTYTRATDEVQLNAAIAAGGTAFEIFTQAPNVNAFTDLMNRALDKPAEQVKMTGADDGPIEFTFRWMTAADESRPKLLKK